LRVSVRASKRARVVAIIAIGLVAGALSELRAQATSTDTVGSCWSYETADAHFQVQVVARGLTVPVSLAFLPDGRALVAERPLGRLSFVDLRTGALTVIDGVPPVVGQVDGGLLDVIVHPDFSRNRWLYFAYSERTDSGNAAIVERARLDGNRLVDRQRLLAVHPYLDNVNQFGARLVLDHRYLYIAVGERDVPELAQDLSSDAGKILRLREDGSIPGDNPFVGRAGVRPEIWSLGHRNPHGLAIEPRTGLLWEHEHGPRGGDEINLIRAGRNYGWPVITYGIEYTGEPVGAGITRHAGMEQPRYFYVPSIAPTGMAFYTGKGFPSWRGNIFLGSLSYRHLNRLVLDGTRIVREERLLRDRQWRIREVRQGPDGFLYLGIEGGLIVRVSPAIEASCARGVGASDPWMTAAQPSPSLTDPVAAYDADDHRVIVLGNARAGAEATDTTWEWDGHAWAAIDGPTPSARTDQSMATDPNGGVVLFGGLDRHGTATNESWHYISRRWSSLHVAGPTARASAAMAFDQDHHRTLMRGGAPCTDRRTWSWDGAAWTVVDSLGPQPRVGASMAYDPTTRTVLLAGGRECDGRLLRASESWRWNGRQWSKLSALPAGESVCLVYSPTRNRMLLFALDSAARSSAWQLRGERWERIGQVPPRLSDATCTADLASERITLMGHAPGSPELATYLLLR
jgi:glucose/arabinose dehydrogenase